MDGGIVTLFNTLVEKGILTSFSLEILLMLAFYYSWRHYLKPMKAKLENMPSCDDIKKTIEQHELNEKEHFEKVDVVLSKLIEFLDNIDDTEKLNTRELNELRRDIEQVKQILNQFQGHMMYREGASRNSDFGNKELR